MVNIEQTLSGPMADMLSMFGEEITIINYTYEGEDPYEGTVSWNRESPITVQARVLEAGEQVEVNTSSGQRVTGEYQVYVASTIDILDGLQSDSQRASVVIDSDGYRYEVLRVTDEHNGLYRCLCSYEMD